MWSFFVFPLEDVAQNTVFIVSLICASFWDYQIDSLKMWAGIVDGFRCDVASLVPVDFWCRTREECEEILAFLILKIYLIFHIQSSLMRVL